MSPLSDEVRAIVEDASAFTVSVLQHPNAALINAQPEQALRAVIVRTERFRTRLQCAIDAGTDQERHTAIVLAMNQLGSLLPDRQTVALAAMSALEAFGVERATAESLAPALACHIRLFGKAETALDQVRLWEPPGPDDTAVHEPFIERPTPVRAESEMETGKFPAMTDDQVFEALFDRIATASAAPVMDAGDTTIEMATHDTTTETGPRDADIPLSNVGPEDMVSEAEKAALMGKAE